MYTSLHIPSRYSRRLAEELSPSRFDKYYQMSNSASAVAASLSSEGTINHETGRSQTSRTQRKLMWVVALSGVFDVRAATRYRLQ